MGKHAMEEMLLLDHQDRALSGRLAQMFVPLLQATLSKQIWEISTNRCEMSAHLRELFEAMRDVDLARYALREKEEKAQELLMRLMRGKDIKVPLTEGISESTYRPSHASASDLEKARTVWKKPSWI